MSDLEGQMERLDQVMSKTVTTAMLFQALLDDGQVERARARLVAALGIGRPLLAQPVASGAGGC